MAPQGGVHVIARLNDNWLTLPLRDALASDPPGITGMSFRFTVVRESWETADGTPITDDRTLLRELENSWDPNVPDEDLPLRKLLELQIAELGPVCWPQYLQTSITVRQGTVDMNRLHEPEQRKLLARAVWTLDSDLPRGGRPLDAAAREVRAMLVQAAARAERLAAGDGDAVARGGRDIDVAAAELAAMRASIAARAARVAALPGVN